MRLNQDSILAVLFKKTNKNKACILILLNQLQSEGLSF